MRLCMVFIAGLFLLSLTNSQTLSDNSRHPQLMPNTWGISFGIATESNSLLPKLGSYMGSTASVRYFFKECTGFRLGISLYGYRENNKSETRTMTNDSLLVSDKNNFSDLSIQLSIQYLSFIKSSHNISIYWAIGPIIGVANGNTINSNYSSISQNETVRQTYTVGLMGSLGAEWMLTDEISLSIEYNSELNYSWYKNENKIDPVNNIYYISQGRIYNSSSEKIIGNSNVRLGVTFSI